MSWAILIFRYLQWTRCNVWKKTLLHCAVSGSGLAVCLWEFFRFITLGFFFLQQSTFFYLKHTFIVGELFVFVGKQSDLALCLCNGGSLFSKGDCRGCEKENYEDCLQFCTLRLLSLFGEIFLWKNLKFYAEMQHFSSNFRQLLNCFENFIIVLRFWSIGWFKWTIYVFFTRIFSKQWSIFLYLFLRQFPGCSKL